MKKTVLVITGSRAEYGLLKTTIKEISKSKLLTLKLLVTGMHTLTEYGLTINEIINDKVIIDHVVKLDAQEDMLGWLSSEIKGIRDYCLKVKPQIILVLGDRDEPLAGALVGSHLGILVAHIHGGDTTGEVTVDDKNRDVITSLATIHFPINKKSQNRVKQILGNKNSKNILMVGNVGTEEITTKISSKKEVYLKHKLVFDLPLVLLVLHPLPLENIPFNVQITSVLQALDKFKVNIVAIKPNSDTGSQIFIKALTQDANINRLYSSLPRTSYLNLLAQCDVLVGNSSSGLLETPYFGTKVVNIGKRQQGRTDYLHMIDVDYDCDKIAEAIKTQLYSKKSRHVKHPQKNSASVLITKYLEKFNIR